VVRKDRSKLSSKILPVRGHLGSVTPIQMRLGMFKAWAACSSLLASSSLAVATEPDELYDEVVATRLAFAAGPAGFPLLPFDAVAHAAPLGDTTVAVLAHSGTASGSLWGLWVVDTAVSGTSAVQVINLFLLIYFTYMIITDRG